MAPAEERLNLQKHGLSFSDASTVFADPCSLSLFNEEHSDEEDRWVTLGMLPNSMMVVVVHTYRVLEAEEYVRPAIPGGQSKGTFSEGCRRQRLAFDCLR